MIFSTQKAKMSLRNNRKVIENYFSLTTLQLLNSLFILVIYPYLIRTLGITQYGLYVFAFSIANYVNVIVTFGYNIHGVREVSLNRDNNANLSKILSNLLSSQVYLFLTCFIMLIVTVYFIPFTRENYWLYVVCGLSAFSPVLFPTWFFQGMEQMKYITVLQLGIKLFSLPFILFLVKTPQDLLLYAIINTTSTLIGSLLAILLIKYHFKIDLVFKPVREFKLYMKEALPFFWGSAASVIKMQSPAFFAGTFISMASVAYYDLASKIVLLIATLLSNINNAFYPKIVKEQNSNMVRKALIGLAIICVIAVLFIFIGGKYIVFLLGGKLMIESYSLMTILSAIIPCWVIVGSIQLFILIPLKRYKSVAISQTIAFIIYMILTIIGSVIFKNIFWIAVAMSVSGVAELCYNFVIVRKHNLLSKLKPV